MTRMKVLIVYAHPDPSSFCAALKGAAAEAIHKAGHQAIISDLYAEGFNPVAGRHDFLAAADAERFHYQSEQLHAAQTLGFCGEISREQGRVEAANAIVFLFPLWWGGPPAILKGWIDRVYAFGFAYGVGPYGGSQWGKRFGEGALEGRRAMVATTVGGRMSHYGPRGVGGAIDDLLWPIQHGVLFYPGMTVVPPVVFYEVNRPTPEAVESMADDYVRRLLDIATAEPIAFRRQNGGEYDDVQVLKPEFGAGLTGHAAHQGGTPFVSNVFPGSPGDYTPRHIAPSSRDG